MKDAPSRLLAEFLGVFFLCLFGIGAIVTQAGTIGVALAHGLAIFVAICAFAHISGAHFNPAITLAMAATKRISLVDGLAYIVAQLLGGTAAALLAQYAYGDAWSAGVPTLASTATLTQGILVEAIATFALVIVVMGVAVDQRGTFAAVAGLPIGLVITADIFWSGPITGAAMNPARWFGPALVNGGFGNALVWIVGPILGALVAAYVYDLVMKPAKTA
ncbi:MAG: aquaporin [Actinomycetales bacterium]|nr:aquaporin [Actinomycetales bacterium]